MENDDKPKNSGRFGKGNPGKPKGAVTKTGKMAKDAIALAAEKLGGADRLVAWAQEEPANERVFWGTIYPKLLPLQVQGPGSEGEHLYREIVRKVIDPNGRT